jgi:hypothetical protein
MKFLVFELSFINILINHSKFSLSSLIILPYSFKFRTIWPYHGTFPIPLIKFPDPFKFGNLRCHNNIIELWHGHLTLTISFAIPEVAGVDVSTRVVGSAETVEAAFREGAIGYLVGVFLGSEDATMLVLVLARDEEVFMEGAGCFSFLAGELTFAVALVVKPVASVSKT